MELAIDGAALIREAHGKRSSEESLQDSLRRVIQERYPGHVEEVLRATKLLMDMMNLLEGKNAKRVSQELMRGNYRLSMVLDVDSTTRLATGASWLTKATATHCPRCGGEYLPEFNFCVACGSLWPQGKRTLWGRFLGGARRP